MHEFGVVSEMFERVRKTGKKRKVVIVLGALKGVEPGTFKEMWRELAEGTPLELMEVELRVNPLEVRCHECGFEGRIVDVPHMHSVFTSWPCPQCGGQAEIVTGNEQEIEYLE